MSPSTPSSIRSRDAPLPHAQLKLSDTSGRTSSFTSGIRAASSLCTAFAGFSWRFCTPFACDPVPQCLPSAAAPNAGMVLSWLAVVLCCLFLPLHLTQRAHQLQYGQRDTSCLATLADAGAPGLPALFLSIDSSSFMLITVHALYLLAHSSCLFKLASCSPPKVLQACVLHQFVQPNDRVLGIIYPADPRNNSASPGFPGCCWVCVRYAGISPGNRNAATCPGCGLLS